MSCCEVRTMKTYDLAIVGASSAGVRATPLAARLGARVVLIEKERIGGDCTNLGCVPSKALLKAAQVAHHMRHADELGLDPVHHPTVDLRPRACGRGVHPAGHSGRRAAADQSETRLCVRRRDWQLSVHPLRRLAGINGDSHDALSRLEQ